METLNFLMQGFDVATRPTNLLVALFGAFTLAALAVVILTLGLGALGRGVVGQPALHGGQDARLVMVAHGDDEGEAVLFHIVGVDALEGLAFGVGQRVQTGRGLFGRAFRRQPLGLCKLAGKVRVGAQHGELALAIEKGRVIGVKRAETVKPAS